MTVRTALRTSAVAVVAAASLAGCNNAPADPAALLSASIRETLASTFDFSLTIDADREALTGLGEGAGPAALFLQGLEMSGTHADNGNSLAFSLLTIDVFETRTFEPNGDLYLRVALDDIASLSGQGLPDFEERYGAQLDELGLSEPVQVAIESLLGGGWVGITGGVDQAAVQEIFASLAPTPASPMPVASDIEAGLRAAFGGDIDGFLQRFATVTERGTDQGVRTLVVALKVREVVRTFAEFATTFAPPGEADLSDLDADLEQLPAAVDFVVEVEQGYVREISLDIADIARQVGGDASEEAVEGSIALTLELTGHGAVDPVELPETAVTITGDQFLEALRLVAAHPEVFEQPTPPG